MSVQPSGPAADSHRDPGAEAVFVDGLREPNGQQAAVEAFRGSGPSDEQSAAMLSASVAEYDVADMRPLT